MYQKLEAIKSASGQCVWQDLEKLSVIPSQKGLELEIPAELPSEFRENYGAAHCWIPALQVVIFTDSASN